MVGELDLSEALLNAMKTQLNISDAVYRSWFNLYPKNNSLDNLNGLVTHPFFIYCNRNATMKAQ